ncbi:MAG TPA: hypothetical protein VM899_16740 [Rubellimicrobium sp.]|nr:hypothetical protein [Rubellimicrobium sp.]
MASQQPGAPSGTEQMGASQTPSPQMTASQPPKPSKAPGFAAFGTTGGAAIVFRDLASI